MQNKKLRRSRDKITVTCKITSKLIHKFKNNNEMRSKMIKKDVIVVQHNL